MPTPPRSAKDYASYGISDPKEVMALVAQLRPLFAGKAPAVQGAALADLLAIWLVGHYVPGSAAETQSMRADLLAMHLEMLDLLIEPNAREMGTWQQ